MANLKISPQAQKDLLEIKEYISEELEVHSAMLGKSANRKRKSGKRIMKIIWRAGNGKAAT